MLRAPFLVAAVVFPVFVVCSQTAPKPSVGVFLDFDSAPGDASVEVMKKEAASLLKAAGVSLDWRLASENRGDESFAGLVVLKFKGVCKVEAWLPKPAPGETRALAATEVDDGRVMPFSEVQCDEVRRALSYLRPQASRAERQKALGLALGRVVAHELYHVLTRTTAHTTHGLAKAAETLTDLVAIQSLSFRAEDSEAIRKALAQ